MSQLQSEFPTPAHALFATPEAMSGANGGVYMLALNVTPYLRRRQIYAHLWTVGGDMKATFGLEFFNGAEKVGAITQTVWESNLRPTTQTFGWQFNTVQANAGLLNWNLDGGLRVACGEASGTDHFRSIAPLKLSLAITQIRMVFGTVDRGATEVWTAGPDVRAFLACLSNAPMH